MKWPLIVLLSVIISLWADHSQAQATDYFAGWYGGVEIGTVSYNTQINFDGVDDPAGRGGFLYGAFVGYNQPFGKMVVGAELLVHAASVPDPYTFDPRVVGFAALDLRRGTSVGLDARAGYLVHQRLLLYGNVGFSVNEQSVRIDGVPLEQIAGGAADKQFGAFQYGAGLAFAAHRKLRVRFSFRTLAGHDLSAIDFGTIPQDAALTHLDVAPRQQQFLTGLLFRF